MAQKFKDILELRDQDIIAAEALRQKSIDDALALEKGPSYSEQKLHDLWSNDDFHVGVGKPGKEAKRRRPNPHDMWPYIRESGELKNESATFGQIFLELEHMHAKSRYALELLGCLLVRSAYMLDHTVEKDRVVYRPPMAVVEEIAKEIPTMFNVPLYVFLQYLEAIALQEDVKYQRNLNARGEPYGKTAGRPNNLLTCARLIAHLLGKVGLVEFAYGFAKQRGVSALQPNELASSFPLLAPESAQAKLIKKITEK